MAYRADIAFRLKNGKTIERTLVMQEELWEKFILCDSVRDIYFTIPETEEIIYIETELGRLQKPIEAWEIIREEFELMSDADKLDFVYTGYSKYFMGEEALFVEVWVEPPNGNGSYVASYPLTKTKTPKAYALLSDEKTYSSTDKTTEWTENYDEDIVFYE